MKRMSIAEQTLWKEVKVHQGQIEAFETEIRMLKGKIDIVFTLKNHLEGEANRLRHVREAASVKNKL